VVRAATGVLFLLFGEYKVAGPGFAHGGFQQYLQAYIGGDAVAFYRPFRAHVVLPYAVFFGSVVGVLELCIGVSLVLGMVGASGVDCGCFFYAQPGAGDVVGTRARCRPLALLRRGTR
jgi:hypothetical protein